MRYLPDGVSMQKADNYTIWELGVPSMVLMERAALAAVEEMERASMDFGRTLVVCGSGNNGGDGFAIARILKERGYAPTVLFVGKESSLSNDCRTQKKIAENYGVRIVTEFSEAEYSETGKERAAAKKCSAPEMNSMADSYSAAIADAVCGCDVVVDAVFGVGLNREITGRYWEVIGWMNTLPGRKVAVDIPSGISSATGEVLGIAFRAELTVTFACEKLGCVLYPGAEYAGKTVVKDIGISRQIFEGQQGICYTYEREDLRRLLPKRKANSHKGTYGKVLMITGSRGMSGAAYLSAKAAYKTGAGLVQIYTAEENRTILQGLLPEAILSTYTEYEEEKLKQLLAWADVVCIGCGLGQSRLSEKILTETMKMVTTPCVVDADGLNLLSVHPELLKKEERPFVFTPHMKEMAGLLGCSVSELQADRFEMTREFTEGYGVVCVLKDARTIVRKRNAPIFVNTSGNSAMAKAGSGDVLSGVIAGLLAQGCEPFMAAQLGVYLHGCAGDAARECRGSYSVLAEDLIAGIEECIKL